jgi:hypothetical protein
MRLRPDRTIEDFSANATAKCPERDTSQFPATGRAGSSSAIRGPARVKGADGLAPIVRSASARWIDFVHHQDPDNVIRDKCIANTARDIRRLARKESGPFLGARQVAPVSKEF